LEFFECQKRITVPFFGSKKAKKNPSSTPGHSIRLTLSELKQPMNRSSEEIFFTKTCRSPLYYDYNYKMSRNYVKICFLKQNMKSFQKSTEHRIKISTSKPMNKSVENTKYLKNNKFCESI